MSLFVALALLAAAPAAGDDPNSIIVTGTPDAKREERKRAAEFVRRTGVATLNPVARWIAPVCPRTIGVDAKIAGIVDERIRDVAEAAGAPIASQPFTTNLSVIFRSEQRRVGKEGVITCRSWLSPYYYKNKKN